MTRYPALWHLVNAYLHQDFVLLYGSEQGAVARFISGSPQQIALIGAEISQLVSKASTDTRLEAVLTDLGLEYLPLADGWSSYREWLLDVARRVDEWLAEHAQG